MTPRLATFGLFWFMDCHHAKFGLSFLRNQPFLKKKLYIYGKTKETNHFLFPATTQSFYLLLGNQSVLCSPCLLLQEKEVASLRKTEAQMPPHLHVGSLAASGRTAVRPRARTPPCLHYVNVWARGGRGRRRQICESVREAANFFGIFFHIS